MNEHDSLEIQWDKMKNRYATISEPKKSELKEQVLSCIASSDMRKYLSDNYMDLCSWDLIAIIVGSQKPLDFKLNLLKKLSELFPHPFAELDSCYDFEPYVELYEAAISDMKPNAERTEVYLLTQYNYHETDGQESALYIPFFSFDAAIQYIKTDVNDWLDWSRAESIEEALTWFEIEKWVGNDRTSLKATYTISKYGEIWDYRPVKNDLHHEFGMDNALGLYLPVPFAAGDVITIDCRPFAPFKHGVIVSIGDNHDCCCVQCLYAKSDGTIDVGALKHSHVFDDGFTPYISPLYRAVIVQGQLPAEDDYFREIGEAIAKWDEELRSQKDFNVYAHALEYKISTLLEAGNSKDVFLESIRSELLKEAKS